MCRWRVPDTVMHCSANLTAAYCPTQPPDDAAVARAVEAHSIALQQLMEGAELMGGRIGMVPPCMACTDGTGTLLTLALQFLTRWIGNAKEKATAEKRLARECICTMYERCHPEGELRRAITQGQRVAVSVFNTNIRCSQHARRHQRQHPTLHHTLSNLHVMYHAQALMHRTTEGAPCSTPGACSHV